MPIAHVLINCDLGFENQVISDLQKLNSIQEVKGVYGVYDVIVKLYSPNIQELRENITEDIRKIKNVISTITLLDSSGFS
jgi:DNA-binding Lrp family transcriptional regulator